MKVLKWVRHIFPFYNNISPLTSNSLGKGVRRLTFGLPGFSLSPNGVQSRPTLVLDFGLGGRKPGPREGTWGPQSQKQPMSESN